LFLRYLCYNITLSTATLSVRTVPLSGNQTVVIQHDIKSVTSVYSWRGVQESNCSNVDISLHSCYINMTGRCKDYLGSSLLILETVLRLLMYSVSQTHSR